MISEKEIIEILYKIQEHPDYDYGLNKNQLRKYAKQIISKLPKLELITKGFLKFDRNCMWIDDEDFYDEVNHFIVNKQDKYGNKNINIYVEIVDE